MGKHIHGIIQTSPKKRPVFSETVIHERLPEDPYAPLPFKRWRKLARRRTIVKKSIKTNRLLQRQRS